LELLTITAILTIATMFAIGFLTGRGIALSIAGRSK